MRHALKILVLAPAVFLAACDGTPSYVISKSEMAAVMADMHVADAVVSLNSQAYRSDSSRMLLRQSVLERHGVTAAEFDTSLYWYGRNLDKYADVYDRAVKILEKRSSDLGGMAAVTGGVTLSGDSVDVWTGARYAFLTSRLPSRSVRFSLPADDNSESGDVYTWRLKLLDEGHASVRWNMVARYADNTLDVLGSTTSRRGLNEMSFATDSTKTLVRLDGFVEIKPGGIASERDGEMSVDSIALLRRRMSPEQNMLRSRIKSFKDI